MQTVRTIETPNRTVYIGIQTIIKTKYEQDEEQREELKYMVIQKTLALFLLIGGTAMAIMFGEATGVFLACIGFLLLIAKQYVLVI